MVLIKHVPRYECNERSKHASVCRFQIFFSSSFFLPSSFSIFFFFFFLLLDAVDIFSLRQALTIHIHPSVSLRQLTRSWIRDPTFFPNAASGINLKRRTKIRMAVCFK